VRFIRAWHFGHGGREDELIVARLGAGGSATLSVTGNSRRRGGDAAIRRSLRPGVDINQKRPLLKSKRGPLSVPTIKRGQPPNIGTGRIRPLENAKQATEKRNPNVASRTDGAGNWL
jgi:hypothetical protein